MNNGDASTSRDDEPARGAAAARRSAAEDFGTAVSRIAVAQICEGLGFDSFRDSALDSLADITIRYLRDLGKAASFYANLAGRTQCNVFDIVSALEDLGNSQGFSGASGVGQCLVGSGTVDEIVQYVEKTEEIPFAQPLPWFPVARERRLIPSFAQMSEVPPDKHVPDWLPALPDPHTYKQTPIWNERESDPREDKIEQARQRRKAERSLLNLQQRLAFHGAAGASTLYHVPDEKLKEMQVLEGNPNPYLAKPLQAGEKEVSSVAMPDSISEKPESEKDNHVSVLEIFGPAIEAMRDQFVDVVDGDGGTGNGKSMILPEKRPAIHFQLKKTKHVSGQSVDLSSRNQNVGRPVSLTVRDDERDDKKRRAEYILRQAMENPQELTQL